MPNIILSYADIIGISKKIKETNKPGFTRIQYQKIVFSCEHDLILTSLLATFPPFNFKKYYIHARQQFQEETVYNVHDPVFKATREATKRWLETQITDVPLERKLLLAELEKKLFSAFQSRIDASATVAEKKDRIAFFNYIISSYYKGSTGAETVLRALNYCLSKSGEEREDALTITFTSLEQAREAFDLDDRKNTFSCLAGVDERILDGASVWHCISEGYIVDVNSKTMDHLIHPFISRQATGLMPSNLLYSLYVHAMQSLNVEGNETLFDKIIEETNPLEVMKSYYIDLFSLDHLELLNSIMPLDSCQAALFVRNFKSFNFNKEQVLYEAKEHREALCSLAFQHQEANLQGFYCYYVINEALLRGLTDVVLNILTMVPDLDYFHSPLPCQDSVMAQAVVLCNEKDLFRSNLKIQSRLVIWLVRQNYTLSIKALMALEPKLVNMEAFGCAALRTAAVSGHLEMVQILLGVPGIKVNAADKDGRTALGLAISNHYEIAELLVKNGAMFNLVIENAIWKNQKDNFIYTVGLLIIIGCILTMYFLVGLLSILMAMVFFVLRGVKSKDLVEVFNSSWQEFVAGINASITISRFSLVLSSIVAGINVLFARKQIELYKNIPLEKDSDAQAFIEGKSCAKHTLFGYVNYCRSFIGSRKPGELEQWRAGYIKELVKGANRII